MWESTNLDSSAAEGPDDAGAVPGDRAPAETPAEPAAPRHDAVENELNGHPAPRWTPHHFPAHSAARVFSALASAGSPTGNGSTNGAVTPPEQPAPAGNGEVAADPEPPSQGWSPEAAEARRRAQERWRQIPPSRLLPALTVPVTRAPRAQLLGEPLELEQDEFEQDEFEQDEFEKPEVQVPPAPTALLVAPWLPARAPAETAAVTRFGPPGRRRSPSMVVFLSIITLGFYALWWHHKVNHEMAEFDPRMMAVNVGRSTWAVAIPLIIGWMVAAAAGARYLLALAGIPTADLPISAEQSLLLAFAPLVVPYLELLLPFSAAAVLMTHERARVIQDRVHVPVDRQIQPSAALAWLVVPISGGLVGMKRLQQHLNEVWLAVTS
jgi:hypothetical protein